MCLFIIQMRKFLLWFGKLEMFLDTTTGFFHVCPAPSFCLATIGRLLAREAVYDGPLVTKIEKSVYTDRQTDRYACILRSTHDIISRGKKGKHAMLLVPVTLSEYLIYCFSLQFCMIWTSCTLQIGRAHV